MRKKLDFSDFISMLHELDDQIYDNITIRAIGGFSIILHTKVQNLNFPRVSEDIDSLTKTWNEKEGQGLTHSNQGLIDYLNQDINQIIYKIGEKYGINSKYSSWLNNSWYDTQMYYDELENYIEWVPYTEENFKHIRLVYADLESIFLFKMRSVEEYVKDGYDEPRTNDIYDIQSILKIYDEDDIENLQNTKMAIAIEMYPSAVRWIKENIRL